MPDNSEAGGAFESHVLTSVVKTLFEGQARKLPAISLLKDVFPDSLASDPCLHYLDILYEHREKQNFNLMKEYDKVKASSNKAKRKAKV